MLLTALPDVSKMSIHGAKDSAVECCFKEYYCGSLYIEIASEFTCSCDVVSLLNYSSCYTVCG